MKVSIVVITAREDPGFLELAQSVQKSTHKEVELILVDRLKEARGEVWTLACEKAAIEFQHLTDNNPIKGPCPASARNRGISQASGDLIVCLDDLSSFDPNFIAHHVARARSGFDAVAGSYIEVIAGHERFDPRTTDQRQDSGKWIADRYYGMHMAFTKKAWSVVGGFDESFDGAYGYEDCDFGRRMFRAGLSIGWFPELKVTCFKDSRHNLSSLSVGLNYQGEGTERTARDEPRTILYGEHKWKNDKLLLLNDQLKTLDGGYKHEK